MANSLPWVVSALLGAAGVLILIGPTRSLIDRGTSLATWLLVCAAALDLVLGARLSPAAPLAPWASALVLMVFALGKTTSSDPQPVRLTAGTSPDADSSGSIDVDWMTGLSEIHDAVALFEGRRRLLANPAWREIFDNTEDEDRLMAPLLAKAERQGSLSDERLHLPVASWARTDLSEPLDGRVSILPLGDGTGPGSSRWLVTIPSRQARHLALFTRHTAHHFNNMLSAIVGGAGMAMDTVAEGSETYRELLDIENMAMRAADLTGDLQQAAREVAPPDPIATPGPKTEPVRTEADPEP